MHPAKTEVRFRNAGLVRALIVHALKEGLAREGKRTAANSDGAALASFRPSFAPRPGNWDWRRSPAYPAGPMPGFEGSAATAFAEPGQAAFDVGTPTADVRFQPAAIRRFARPSAGCGADANPRDLYRVADPRRARGGGPARRA